MDTRPANRYICFLLFLLFANTLSANESQSDYESWLQRPVHIIGVMQPERIGGQIGIQLVQTNQLIHANEAREKYGYTGSGYAIAIIDSGVDYTHPAFGGGFGSEYRVIAGWDFVNNDADPMDDNGHGTHVAGIAAGNDPFYKGIVPDANIIALKVANSAGNGTLSAIEKAFQWVITHRDTYNIVAVNLSMGYGNFNSVADSYMEDEFEALNNAGVFITASTGNLFYTYNSAPGMASPAVSSRVVSVGATWDASEGGYGWDSGAIDYLTAPSRITSFSQRNAATSIFAPGAILTSPYLGGGYRTLGGTSMAAPIVAGAAVMVHQALADKSRKDLASQEQILQFFKDSGTSIIDGDDEDCNVTSTGLEFKMIDLLAAMDEVDARTAPTPTPTPIPLGTPLLDRVELRESTGSRAKDTLVYFGYDKQAPPCLGAYDENGNHLNPDHTFLCEWGGPMIFPTEIERWAPQSAFVRDIVVGEKIRVCYVTDPSACSEFVTVTCYGSACPPAPKPDPVFCMPPSGDISSNMEALRKILHEISSLTDKEVIRKALSCIASYRNFIINQIRSSEPGPRTQLLLKRLRRLLTRVIRFSDRSPLRAAHYRSAYNGGRVARLKRQMHRAMRLTLRIEKTAIR